jgi:hypothetical protein
MAVITRKFMLVTTDGKSFDPETEGLAAENHQLQVDLTDLLQIQLKGAVVTPLTVASTIVRNKAAINALMAKHTQRTAKYRKSVKPA